MLYKPNRTEPNRTEPNRNQQLTKQTENKQKTTIVLDFVVLCFVFCVLVLCVRFWFSFFAFFFLCDHFLYSVLLFIHSFMIWIIFSSLLLLYLILPVLPSNSVLLLPSLFSHILFYSLDIVSLPQHSLVNLDLDQLIRIELK